MSNDDFRREINRTFDEIAGSPSPALSDRVRSSLADVPEERGAFWVAGLAAALIAAFVVGILFIGNPLSHRPSSAGHGAGSTSTPTVSLSPGPSPSPTPGSTLPPFICASSSPTTSAQAPAVAFISSVRTGTHAGYDRLTITFKNGLPASFELHVQAGTSFTQGASGQVVTLAGKNGILLIIHGADLHTDYSGSTDLKTGYPALLEVRQVEDFEGVVQLGLGVSGATCYRAFYLSNPDRLVIDIQSA